MPIRARRLPPVARGGHDHVEISTGVEDNAIYLTLGEFAQFVADVKAGRYDIVITGPGSQPIEE